MEEQILKMILDNAQYPSRVIAKEITNHFKEFIKWKDDLHNPFIVHYNGEDPSRPKISYDKGSKNCTLDEVYDFWENTKV